MILSIPGHYVTAIGFIESVGYAINDPGHPIKSMKKDSYNGLRRFKPGDKNEKASSLTIMAYPKSQ